MERHSVQQMSFGLVVILLMILTFEYSGIEKNLLSVVSWNILTIFIYTFTSKLFLVDQGFSDKESVINISIPLSMMLTSYMIFSLSSFEVVYAVIAGALNVMIVYIVATYTMVIPEYFTGEYINSVEPCVSKDERYNAVYSNKHRVIVTDNKRRKKIMFKCDYEPDWIKFSTGGKYLFVHYTYHKTKHIIGCDLATKKVFNVIEYKRKGIYFHNTMTNNDNVLLFSRDHALYSLNIFSGKTEEVEEGDVFDEHQRIKTIDFSRNADVVQTINDKHFLIKYSNVIQMGDYRIVDEEENEVSTVLRKTDLPHGALNIGRPLKEAKGVVLTGNEKYRKNYVVVVISQSLEDYCPFMQYLAQRGYDVICTDPWNASQIRFETYEKAFLFIKDDIQLADDYIHQFSKVVLLHHNEDIDKFVDRVEQFENSIAVVRSLYDFDNVSFNVPIVEYSKNPIRLIRLLQ